MSWEESMFAVFDDLEQQAEGLHLVERDAEVADLTVAEYARVSLASRLHASLGQDLRVRLLGGRVVGGRLARLGEDWLLLVDGASEWVVRHRGRRHASAGSPRRAHSEDTWSVVDRLTLRAVLRRLAAPTSPAWCTSATTSRSQGRIGRVGQGLLRAHRRRGRRTAVVQAVPNAAVAALQGRR